MIWLFFVFQLVASQDFVRLDTYNVDKDSLSISGLSSGGGFTNIFNVVNSGHVKGAAVFAGMPYGCLRVQDCEDVSALVQYAQNMAAQGHVDNPSNLAGKPLYVFHGTEDWMVTMSMAEAIRDFYTELGAEMNTNLTSNCGHGVPTLDYGEECSETGLPGLNKCSWNGAYASLQHIYKDLTNPGADQTLDGQFIEFGQTEFLAGESMHSFDEAGFAYIPSGCVDKTQECRIHVHFHGCFVIRWTLGDEYAKNSGFSEVGEVNNVIVLFPQLAPELVDGNVGGCWDNLGYSGEDYDQKTSTQIRIIQKMIDRVTG